MHHESDLILTYSTPIILVTASPLKPEQHTDRALNKVEVFFYHQHSQSRTDMESVMTLGAQPLLVRLIQPLCPYSSVQRGGKEEEGTCLPIKITSQSSRYHFFHPIGWNFVTCPHLITSVAGEYHLVLCSVEPFGRRRA